MDQDWDLSLRVTERYLGAHSVIQHHSKLGKNVTKELATGSCIMERVKRLADKEIVLGIEIPTIESRASNIPMTKGTTYVVVRFDQDLRRICRNQYEHPGSTIVY